MRAAGRGYDLPMPPDAPEERERQDWALRIETCRIGLWRGYLTAAFCAWSVDRTPSTAVAEPSTPFRWRKGAGAETEEARLAHYELLARLKSAGWTPTGRGEEWYETELALPVLVPQEELVEETDDEPERVPVPPPVVVALRERAPAEPEAPPRPVLVTETPEPRGRVDRWQVMAAAGLVTALGLLGWVAMHASTLGT